MENLRYFNDHNLDQEKNGPYQDSLREEKHQLHTRTLAHRFSKKNKSTSTKGLNKKTLLYYIYINYKTTYH